MHVRALSVLAAFFLGLSAFAQAPPSLDGRWSVKYPSMRGATIEVNVVVTNGTGTWQALLKNRNDPCIGTEFPLAMTNATAEGVDVVVSGSKALQGCPDFVWRANRVDDKTYEGTLRDGRKFVMTRL